MKLWKDYSDVDQKRLTQLLEDMIPYYERIAVYSVDKEFVRNNKNTNLQNAAECFRMGIMMADLPEI